MFDLSQLRCFVAAAEELHFGRAAQRLNMTQSPLSRQIQLLERILDVMLLERTSRQVRLTPAGSAFLIEARRILRLAESAALSARRVARGDAGRVVIGFTAVSGYDLMPRIVAQAIARLPNIALELREMVTSPGGTTIAAIRELEQAGVRAAFLNAIQAAMDRSRELARGEQ